MMTRTVTPEDLARLRTRREESDRLYNEALTMLDAAKQQMPDLPHPPPPPDDAGVAPLNEGWQILGDGRPAWTEALRWPARRVAALVWRLVSPYLERQQAFNASLVDHVNRNLPVERETQRAIASTIDALRDRITHISGFELLVVHSLQQVTGFVESKTFESDAHSRRLHEDNRELIDLIDHRTVALGGAISGVGGAISGVGDELAKRWESMVAREQRYDAKVASIAAAHDELRGTLAILQQAANVLKRELERLETGGGAARVAPGATGTAPVRDAPGGFEQARAATIDSFKYVGFEDRFRGTQDDIRGRLEEYLPYFEGATDVLDLGCGRGEFLDLLTDRGVSCRGIDLNHEMVETCRARGLDVTERDALGYLQTLPDGTLGGVFAAQVVEHLQPDYLLAVIDAAYHKLRPGSRIILETINPACWYAFFASYIRDITHVRPLHPETLSYFVQASGFQRVTIRYRAPYPEHDKLQRVAGDGTLAETVNANTEKLNALLFTYLDYAVVAERL
jgi:SAM-dependent methyltransferase